MAKAILVLDHSPKHCFNCPLIIDRLAYGPICVITGSNADAEETPDDCPLIPEPERVKEDGFINDFMYKCGWNACLDALEKGNEGTSPSQHLHDEAGRK